mmetsp:Transcript_10388/g.23181  ORF Transcript_10388/g.23181 Transcript_10388/m.23181 type:complete len:94 (-) Transcript_10388:410-691(-)
MYGAKLPQAVKSTQQFWRSSICPPTPAQRLKFQFFCYTPGQWLLQKPELTTPQDRSFRCRTQKAVGSERLDESAAKRQGRKCSQPQDEHRRRY